jgi:DNA-binding transcriptional LysR family regulator
VYDPAISRRVFRVHMSDIGESRFLPLLMAVLQREAPGVRVETMPVPRHEIGEALDAGRIDMAFGFLALREMQRVPLLRDHYVVLVRKEHPFLRVARSPRGLLMALKELEFVAVRSHADTLRILEAAELQDRLRLTTEHFLVLPSIVKATNLAAIMPMNIALGFGSGFSIAEPEFPLRNFTVALHWSRRFEDDPGNRWLRELVIRLFKE